MNTMNETSLTRAADPVCVFIGDTLLTSSGSVAIDGLEKRGELVSCNPDYNSGSVPVQENSSAAEAQDAPPVAGGSDWFELAALDAMHAGYISTNGYERIIEAHRRRHE